MSASSDLEVSVAITLAAAFVVVYTVAGGLLADVVTDFVQSIAVIVGLVVLFVAVAGANGGITALAATRLPLLASVAIGVASIVLLRWAVPA